MAGRPATLSVRITGDNTQGRRAIREVDSDLGRLEGSSGKLGKVLGGLAVGAAVGELVELGKACFDAASAAEQAAGAVESVFGDAADKVKAHAEAAAEVVGLSASAYNQTSSILGAQLKNMGVAGGELTGTTDDLIKKGADLAAMFGGTTADAVDALSSLLRGERDPIERYGVSINQAAIDAQKAKMGLDGLSGAADRNANMQATLALLTDQTASATGQFARESDSAAGAGQRLSAKMENLQANIGEALLPIFVQVAEWIEDKLLPAAEEFGRELGDTLGPIITEVGAFITDVLVPAFEKVWAFIQDYVIPILREVLTPVIEAIAENWKKVSDKISELIDGPLSDLFTQLEPVATWLRDTVAPIVGDVFGFAFSVAGDAIVIAIGVIGDIIDKITTLVSWIQTAVDWLGRLGSKTAEMDQSGSYNSPSTNLLSQPGAVWGGASAPAAAWLERAEALAAAGLTTGAGRSGGGGWLAPTIRLGATNVTVVLDDEPIRGIVRDVVTDFDAGDARDLRYGVRGVI